jgi:hypothetical protein
VPRALRRFLVPALTCALALSGCTKDKKEGAKPSQSTEPPTTGTPSPGGATPSPVALSAIAIADQLGCTDRTPGQKAATDPVEPVKAIDCKVGDVTYGIRTYKSNTDRDAVLKAAPTDSGYRNVGERSVVTTMTETAANYVLQKTGARIEDTRYTTPGS